MSFIKRLFLFIVGLLIIIILVGILSIDFTDRSVESDIISTIEINGQEIKVEIVDDYISRAKGLSERESIGEDEGMIFLFEDKGIKTFWMKDMNFPIDIIWIDGDVVVGIKEEVHPEPGVSDNELTLYSSPQSVDKVLEIKAGGVGLFDISIGDEIIIKTNESSL